MSRRRRQRRRNNALRIHLHWRLEKVSNNKTREKREKTDVNLKKEAFSDVIVGSMHNNLYLVLLIRGILISIRTRGGDRLDTAALEKEKLLIRIESREGK